VQKFNDGGVLVMECESLGDITQLYHNGFLEV
jgi:hypothetical protein